MTQTCIHRAGAPQVLEASDGSFVVRVPVVMRRRGGRKAVVVKGSKPSAMHRIPTPLQQALVNGYDWQAMLESGEATSISELAECMGVERAKASRALNLTLLAPDVVEAILDETLPDRITLMDLATGTPLTWDEQRTRFMPI